MTKRQVKRQENAKPLWQARRELADRSPVDEAAVEFDLARKQIAGLRDPARRDEMWKGLAQAIRQFLVSSG